MLIQVTNIGRGGGGFVNLTFLVPSTLVPPMDNYFSNRFITCHCHSSRKCIIYLGKEVANNDVFCLLCTLIFSEHSASLRFTRQTKDRNIAPGDACDSATSEWLHGRCSCGRPVPPPPPAALLIPVIAMFAETSQLAHITGLLTSCSTGADSRAVGHICSLLWRNEN